MADVAELIARVRAHGANVQIDGGKLQVVNAKKLPAGALDYIKRYGKEIAAFLDDEAEFEERAAIIEHDGGMPRDAAESFARLLLSRPPSGVVPADWTWFVGLASKIMAGQAA